MRFLDLDDVDAALARLSSVAPMAPIELAPVAIIVDAPIVAPVDVDAIATARVIADRATIEAIGAKTANVVYREGMRVNATGVANASKFRREYDALPETGEACASLERTIAGEDRADRLSHTSEIMIGDGSLAVADRHHDAGRLTPSAAKSLASYVDASDGIAWILRQRNAGAMLTSTCHEHPVAIRLRERNALGAGRETYAVVSSRYAPIDADTVARIVRDCAPGGTRAEVNYDRGHAAGWIDVRVHSDVPATDYRCGEAFSAGVRIPFDDVGDGSCTPSAWFLRNLCLNLIITDRATRTYGRVVHRGRSVDRILALRAKLRQAFSADHGIGRFIAQWDAIGRMPVTPRPLAVRGAEITPWQDATPRQRVEGVYMGLQRAGALAPGVTLADAPKLADAYGRDVLTGEFSTPTLAGVINGITRYAHEDCADRWTGAALEKAAGALTWRSSGELAYAYVAQ